MFNLSTRPTKKVLAYVPAVGKLLTASHKTDPKKHRISQASDQIFILHHQGQKQWKINLVFDENVFRQVG